MTSAPDASSSSTASAPPSRSNVVRDDEALVRLDARGREARAGTRRGAPGRRAGTVGPARNAIRRWPRPTSASIIVAIPAVLSTPTSGSPPAWGERWTTAAPSARIAARCRARSSSSSGSARPEPAKITTAARIERRSRTYERSRSGSRSELQVMTRNPAGDAASSTPRTTSLKYGSVMSWTITPTTGIRFSAGRGRARWGRSRASGRRRARARGSPRSPGSPLADTTRDAVATDTPASRATSVMDDMTLRSAQYG